MFTNRHRRISLRTLGFLFLIPGLLWGVPALIMDNFTGFTMGFCLFAVLFGSLMLCLPTFIAVFTRNRPTPSTKI